MQKFVKIMHNNPAQMAKNVVVSEGGNAHFLRNEFLPALYVANAVRQREVEHAASAAPRLGNDMLNCYRMIRKRRESEHHHPLAVDTAIAVAFLEGGDPVGGGSLRPTGDRLLKEAGEVFGKLCGHNERRLGAVVGYVRGHDASPDMGQRVVPAWLNALFLTPPTVIPSAAAASSIV